MILCSLEEVDMNFGDNRLEPTLIIEEYFLLPDQILMNTFTVRRIDEHPNNHRQRIDNC